MKEPMINHIAIIGGGACGLWTALALKDTPNNLNVVIYERFDTIGKKIAMSGNSKGNLTNVNVRSKAYCDPDFANQILGDYDHTWILNSFEKLGIKVLIDEAGRVYPHSENAKSVVMMMKRSLEIRQVKFQYHQAIENIVYQADQQKYVIEGKQFDAVVLATGSNAGLGPKIPVRTYPLINNTDPFMTTRRFPALCAIGVTDNIKSLENVRVKVAITLALGHETYGAKGEVQFIKEAISGIATFILSSYIARQMVKVGKLTEPTLLILDLIPDMSYQEIHDYLKTQINGHFHSESLIGILHPDLSAWIFSRYRKIHAHGCDVKQLSELLKHVSFTVSNQYVASNNQVLAGGIALEEIEAKTLETRKYPRLYVGGELLDLDGLCGGYNLHMAFACGEVIAHDILKRNHN